jgi:hypothetical protein
MRCATVYSGRYVLTLLETNLCFNLRDRKETTQKLATTFASEKLIQTYQNVWCEITQYYYLNTHPGVQKFPNHLVAFAKFQVP